MNTKIKNIVSPCKRRRLKRRKRYKGQLKKQLQLLVFSSIATSDYDYFKYVNGELYFSANDVFWDTVESYVVSDKVSK